MVALSNGVRVIVKPTEFKQDEILFYATSLGGYSQVKTEDLPSALLATDVVELAGLADMNVTDLQKALTGKRVSLSPSISGNSEILSGPLPPQLPP